MSAPGGPGTGARRLVLRFLADRLGVMLLAVAIAAVLLTMTTLLLAVAHLPAELIRSNVGYGLLLAATLLAIYLAADLLRWWPQARQAQTLLKQEVELTALGNLPAGGTLDQRTAGALLEKLRDRATADRLRYEEATRQHLAFMNLWVHQMKTPVSTINLIAQQTAPLAPAPMESIQEEAARLAEGLEMVLTTARLQDFAVDFHIRRTDLLDSVRAVVNARKKQFIRLEIFPEIIAADGEDWTVLTDAKWNGFVLEQIVANALKYGAQARTAGQGAGQRLKIQLARHGRSVSLTIADQGPGIPPQDLPRVFEPFFTGENGRRYADATGIGLWLVRQVVDRLDHQITIESEPGRGTTVILTYLTTL